MAESNDENKGGSTLLRLLILLIIGGVITGLGRRWAMSKADQEFEERLRLADERRN